MKRGISLILMAVFFMSFAFAATEVTFIGERGDFTGVKLNIRSPGSTELSDPIYAKELLDEVGMAKFDVETSLTEMELVFTLINNGMPAGVVEEGPYVVTGEAIVVDTRVIEEEHVVVEGEENETAEEIEDNETTEEPMEVKENESDIQTESAEAGEGDSNEDGKISRGIISGWIYRITGFATSEVESGRSPYYLIVLSVLIGGGLMFFIVRKAYKSGAEFEKKQIAKEELDKKIDALD